MTAPELPELKIVESVEALWGDALQPAGCPACGQAHLVAENRLGQPCPYCGSGKLAPQPARLRAEPPELLIRFQKSPNELPSILSNFIHEVWLRPDDMDVDRMTGRVVPVFWPMWLVDSDLVGDWSTEVGFDYQVKSSQESFLDGKWQTRDIVETRVRWEPRLGQIQRHFENISVSAVSDHKRMLQLVGSYQRQASEPYRSEYLSDKAGPAAVRIPDLQPEAAWPEAQTNLNQAAAELCRQAAGGQHIRNYAVRAEYRLLHWTQLLFPVYVTHYADDEGKIHPIWINGQTGVIGGLRLASQRKGWRWTAILAAIAVGLFILSLLLLGAGTLFPPAALLGMPLIVVSFMLGVSALVPAIWPWQWNRRHLIPTVKQN